MEKDEAEFPVVLRGEIQVIRRPSSSQMLYFRVFGKVAATACNPFMAEFFMQIG
jgi:hypothetical protein